MNDVITLTTQKVSPGKNKCQHILPGIDETNIHILNAKTGKHSIKSTFRQTHHNHCIYWQVFLLNIIKPPRKLI